MTVADPERFTDKGKPIIYIRAFVELYNWSNRKQVYEIYGIVELKKIYTSTAKHSCNLGAHWIIKIFSILRNLYVVPRDQERIEFYVNNYIN